MSFLTGYVLGMTLNQSPNRSYHERDFEKEQLKIKCREQEHQIADLSKKEERLQEQLEEAQHTIYCIANTDGSNCKTILETIIRDANLYLEKWGVK